MPFSNGSINIFEPVHQNESSKLYIVIRTKLSDDSNESIKGIMHPKMKNLSLIIQPHVVPNPLDLLHSWTLVCYLACLQKEECTLMRSGTIVNMHQSLTQKRINCWIKSLFLFSLRTKIILATSKNYGWTIDATWTILAILPFWALNVSVAFMVRCCLWRVRKLSDLIKNILICVLKIKKIIMGLERHEGE